MSSKSANAARTAVVVLASVVLLHLVFLWNMSTWLWNREHYQFFPLILMGSAGLAAFRLQGATWPTRPVFSVRVALYVLASVASFLLAVIADSHWLGTISALVLAWSAIWYTGGKQIAKLVRGPFFFLLLAVPFPLNLDLSVILSMQKIATSKAGDLLDYVGITHVISGVAIRTDLQEFMVEEACSGIHSLFSCITAMVFWAIINRYHLIRIVFTIAQTAIWVLTANAIRVFLIVYAKHRYGADLESGTPHELLGVMTYAGALLMALSADQLVRFLVPLGFSPFQPDPSQNAYNPQKTSDTSFNGKLESLQRNFNRSLNGPIFSVSRSSIIPIATSLVLLIPLCGISVAQQFQSRREVNTQYFVQSIAESIPVSLLPNRIGGWTQTSSQVINRTPSDPLGTNSVVWRFEGNGISAIVSVDGYYGEFHDLSGCYSGLGWELESSENRVLGEASLPLTELSLYKGTGEVGISLFSCFDSTHAAIQPPEPAGTAFRSIVNRLRSGRLLAKPSAPVNPPVYQVQVMTVRDSQLLSHEQSLLEDLYLGVQTIVLEHMAKQGGKK